MGTRVWAGVRGPLRHGTQASCAIRPSGHRAFLFEGDRQLSNIACSSSCYCRHGVYFHLLLSIPAAELLRDWEGYSLVGRRRSSKVFVPYEVDAIHTHRNHESRQRKILSPAFSPYAIKEISNVFFDSAYKVCRSAVSMISNLTPLSF